MAYSPAPLALDRSKPSPWNVEGAFADPVSAGLWRNLTFLLPLWEGNGSPYETVQSEFATLAGGASWQTGPYGHEVAVASGGEQITYASTVPIDIPTGSVFLLFNGFSGGPADNFAKFVVTVDSEWQLMIHQGTKLRLQINSTDAAVSTDDVSGELWSADDTPVAIAATWNEATGGRLFFQGAELNLDIQNSFTAPSSLTAPLRIGDRADGTRNINGKFQMVVLWGRELSASEVRDLSYDPWRLFRPNWDYLTTATSLYATGDGTITDVVNESDAATPLSPSVDDDPASPDDNDWVNNAVEVT